MPVEQSAIQIVPLPELWPPLDHDPADGSGPDDRGYLQPLAPDQGPALPRQFAVLLVEVLAGVRPVRQLTPWMSTRGSIHLHRLIPLFASGHRPRVLRVLTARPAPGVIEMTLIAVIGQRTRALAVRLEHGPQAQQWQCTDIEAA
jgi:hypothetical protein